MMWTGMLYSESYFRIFFFENPPNNVGHVWMGINQKGRIEIDKSTNAPAPSLKSTTTHFHFLCVSESKKKKRSTKIPKITFVQGTFLFSIKAHVWMIGRKRRVVESRYGKSEPRTPTDRRLVERWSPVSLHRPHQYLPPPLNRPLLSLI